MNVQSNPTEICLWINDQLKCFDVMVFMMFNGNNISQIGFMLYNKNAPHLQCSSMKNERELWLTSKDIHKKKCFFQNSLPYPEPFYNSSLFCWLTFFEFPFAILSVVGRINITNNTNRIIKSEWSQHEHGIEKKRPGTQFL